MAIKALDSGQAWEKFRALVMAQGGDVSYVDDPEMLSRANFIETVSAPRSGYLSCVHARIIGEAAMMLGAGRAKKGDPIDRAVGFVIHHKVGDRVQAGDPLFIIHANDQDRLAQARQQVMEAHNWSDEPVERLPMFYD
jgi:pyrimidine-nucleoside phosphorylase